MRLIILTLFISLLLFLVKAYYDTNTIEVKCYQIKDSPLSEALSGLKVAFLTDLHIRNIDAREKKILEILNEEKPDLIFLAGDYIGFKESYEPVISFFHQIKAPYGIYGVLGNTEYSNENGSCVLCHREHSKSLRQNQYPLFLRNSSRVVEVGDKKINLIGVDDPVKEKSNLNTAIKKVDFRYPTVLLAHSPEMFEEAASHGIDLVLAGHNHGGQLFLTKPLKKVLPLDPVLDFLEGFFREGRTLMYVSRGVGTSYLPFRFGVKPEITFFKFTNDTNENLRVDRIDPTPRSMALNPHPRVSPIITNHPPETVFAGFSLTNLIETFNVFSLLGFAPARRDSSTAAHTILFDFESEEDLSYLNWECGKWFELSEKNATSGKYSLKVSLPSGQYPGIHFQGFKRDWSGSGFLKMDVYQSSEEIILFHIRIDDNQSGWEYANRFDINFTLNPGMNHISIPVDSIKTNLHRRPLNLRRIERMMVFVPNNAKRRELHIDHIRLE